MCLIDLEEDTNFTLQNQSAVKGEKESIFLSRVEGRGKVDSVKSLGFVCSPSFFSLPTACRLFSRGVIFTRARVLLALLSLRKNGGLLVVYVSILLNSPEYLIDKNWNRFINR